MRLENVLRVTQKGYGLDAKEVSMYITALRAEDLVEKGDIYRRTPDQKDGYQRDLQARRIGIGKYGVAGYLLKQMGTIPTSILLNIRKNHSLLWKRDKEIFPSVEIGAIEIPDEAIWYVVDGQHRISGLAIAIRKNNALKDYPVIVTLTNESKFYEMLIFFIVNSRAKSVPTDLVYRILQRMLYEEESPGWAKEEILTGSDRRKAKAARIVDIMNETPKSPFYSRIRRVGEDWDEGHLTNDGRMIRYIAQLITAELFREIPEREVAELLIDYWRAINDLYPDCFENPDDYYLFTALGISSLLRLFHTVYNFAARDQDVSYNKMHLYLSYLLKRTDHDIPEFKKPVNEKWWHRKHGAHTILRGTGEGYYSLVAEWLGTKISEAREQEDKQKG